MGKQISNVLHKMKNLYIYLATKQKYNTRLCEPLRNLLYEEFIAELYTYFI